MPQALGRHAELLLSSGCVKPEICVSKLVPGRIFNFFHGSKRCLEPETAGEWIATLPVKVMKIAVLVNPDWNEVMRMAELPGIDALQLHGAETPEFCHRLKAAGIRFEKALPVTDAESVANVPDFGTDTVLLDSSGPNGFGGSGQPFPWEIARTFVRARELAGLS